MPVRDPETGEYKNWSKFSNKVVAWFALYSVFLAIARAANIEGGYEAAGNEAVLFIASALGSYIALVVIQIAPAYVISEVLLRKPSKIKWTVAIILFLALMFFGLYSILA